MSQQPRQQSSQSCPPHPSASPVPPTNPTILSALHQVTSTSASLEHEPGLSQTSQKVAQDISQAGSTAASAIQELNVGEPAQHFLAHLRNLLMALAEEGKHKTVEGGGEMELQRIAEEGVKRVRDIGMLLWRSVEGRQWIVEMVTAMQGLALESTSSQGPPYQFVQGKESASTAKAQGKTEWMKEEPAEVAEAEQKLAEMAQQEHISHEQKMYKEAEEKTGSGGGTTKAVKKEHEMEEEKLHDVEKELPKEHKLTIADKIAGLFQELHHNPIHSELQTHLSWIATKSREVMVLLSSKHADSNRLKYIQAELICAGCRLSELLENWTDSSTAPFKQKLNFLLDRLGHQDSVPRLLEVLHRAVTDTSYNPKDDLNETIWLFSKTLHDRELRTCFSQVGDDISYFVDRIQRDPLTQRLSQDVSSLYKDAFIQQPTPVGTIPMLRPELIQDAQKILATLLNRLQTIQLHDWHYEDDEWELRLKSLNLNIRELAPKQLSVAFSYDQEASNQTALKIKLAKMHASAVNVSFYVRKKAGMLGWEDEGFADIRVYNPGMRLETTLVGQPESKFEAIGPTPPVTPTKVQTPTLQIASATCDLGHLDLRLHETNKGDWLYGVAGPWLRQVIRKKVEEAVVEWLVNLDLREPVGSVVEGLSQVVSS